MCWISVLQGASGLCGEEDCHQLVISGKDPGGKGDDEHTFSRLAGNITFPRAAGISTDNEGTFAYKGIHA